MADHAQFLNKELYVYFSTPVKPREEVAKMLPEHLEYQVTLEQKGIMFGAGPMFEKGADAPHRGMIIVQANPLEEARRNCRRRSHAHLGHARIYSGALAHERGRRHL